jgi:hypothetical protein
MTCVNHPDVPDVTRCAQCRKRVCQDCYVMLEGRPLCGTCKDQVVRLMERGESVSTGDRGPTPWERKKSFASLVTTLKAAMLQPGEFFRTMSLTGDGHYWYLLAVGWLPGVIGAGLSQVFQGLLVGLSSGTAEGAATGLGISAMMGLVGILCAVVMVPFQLFVGLFISGLICHFCLHILGAANASLEATLRAVAYAQSPTVLNAVPFCGFLVAAIWTLVLQIVALKEVHETTYGKVVLAIFLPSIVCLGLIAGILALTLPFILRQR